jgi:hypothetical protein
MPAIDLPPQQLWLPPRPAIIRPAPAELLLPPHERDPRFEAFTRSGTRHRGVRRRSGAALVTYIGSTSTTTNSVGYTFNGQGIGVASADRHVIVCCGGRQSATSGSQEWSSCTIGGVSATRVASRSTPSSSADNYQPLAIFILLVTSGTSADISVTHAVALRNCAIAIFTATGLQSATPTATLTPAPGTGSGAATGTIDVQAGGALIAVHGPVDTSGTSATTWTGVTEDTDFTVESGDETTFSAAHDNFAAAESARTITASYGSAMQGNAMCVAAFR